MSTLNLHSVRTNLKNEYGKFKIFIPWADDAKHKAENQLHTFTSEDLYCLSTKAISAMDENKTAHEYC